MSTTSKEVSPQQMTMSVAEAAKYFNRSERTIRLWCLDGTLIAFNCSVIRRVNGYVIIVHE